MGAGIAVIVGVAAFWIGFSARQIATAQHTREAVEAGELWSLGLPPVITRMSELFLRTLRDDPADAEVASHKLLIRAGYVRPVGPGLYSWLPLGLRVLRKIEPSSVAR